MHIQKDKTVKQSHGKGKKTVVFFDFDGTLVKRDSLPRFLWFCTPLHKFIPKVFFSLPVLIKYFFKTIDNHTAKEKLFSIFFAGANKEEFMKNAVLFSRQIISGIVRDEAVRRLKWHQEQRHLCILVSASIEEYLVPWAESMGFSKVLATSMDIGGNGSITGKFAGRNCEGFEKVRRAEEYLGNLKGYEIYVYGDSPSDKELLRIADHPYYRSFKEERAYTNG